MKEMLKDRIDVLFDKAIAGDDEAQFKLAKSFYKGILVEKSVDQAKYWAFKSMSSGNSSASDYYNAIVQENNYSNKKIVELCEIISFIPIFEFSVSLIPFLIMNIFKFNDNIFYNICIWFFGVGFISFLISLLFGKIGKSINNLTGKAVGATVGSVIVHIVALWLTFS